MGGAPEPARPGADDEVLYEMVRFGGVVRIAAMHPPALTEVVVHGPTNAGPAALRRLARDRLAILERRSASAHLMPLVCRASML